MLPAFIFRKIYKPMILIEALKKMYGVFSYGCLRKCGKMCMVFKLEFNLWKYEIFFFYIACINKRSLEISEKLLSSTISRRLN